MPDDNQSERSTRVVRNFTFLTTGRVLGDAFTFLLFVLLSRTFGEDGIGKYSFAMAATGIVSMLADFGLYTLSLKAISRLTENLPDHIGRFISLRLMLCLVVFPAFFMLLLVLPLPADTKLIVAIIGVYQIFTVTTQGLFAILLAREHTNLVALLEITNKALALILGSIAIFSGAHLAVATAALPIAALIQLGFACLLLARKVGVPAITFDFKWTRLTLSDALPHGLSLLIFQLHSSAAVLFLGILAGDAAAGTYNVAYRLIFLILLIPYFASLSVSPLASRLYVTDSDAFRQLCHQSLQVAVLLGVPMAFGLWLVAPQTITLVFGDQFDASHPILQTFAILALFAFLSRMTGAFLTAADRQAERTRAEFISTCLNVALCAMLIPPLGPMGAALAIVCAEGILLCLYTLRLRHVVGWPRLEGRLAISLVGAASFAALFWVFEIRSLALVVAGSIVIYGLVLLLFPQTRKREVRFLLDFLSPKS